MRKRRQFKAGRCYRLVSRIAYWAFFFDEEEKNRFAAYIDCNPCEGGICKWPTEYKWCGWTAATEGDEHCRAIAARS